MLGFHIDEPTFPLDDPISLVPPLPSAQSAYINQKKVPLNGRRLSYYGAFHSMEYTTDLVFDTADFSICKLPSNRSQNEAWGMDCLSEMGEKKSPGDKVCKIKLEKGVMDAGFRGQSMKREEYGQESKENIGDYGEAFLASMKEDYVCGLKRNAGNEINFVGDMQASIVASSCRKDSSLRRFLQSNDEELAMDVYSCDEFRMYEFKVRRCTKGRSHDWTECPFAHAGEKARRRDPRRFHYSGTACPDFRRGDCKRGDACELSHGVFECWLHPARYRTHLCKDGKLCKRRVCFFAHSPSELRFISQEPIGSLCKSPFSSFSHSNHKHPQYGVSPSKLAISEGYGGDDCSPTSMHSFPDERLLDAFCPITGDGHIHNNSHLPSNDGNFDSYGIPFDGFSHEHLTFKNSQAHVNLRTQLALASLSSKLDHIMSPKSTLIRHVFSPPALSPPLSPSESPPMSPSMVFPSFNAMSRKMASCYGQASSRDAVTAATDGNHSNINGTAASNALLLPNLAPSNGTAMFANTCGPSPLSMGDHTNGVDMLMATRTQCRQNGVEEPGIEGEAQSPLAIAHICSAYQKIKNKRPAHPLNGVPESRWEVDQTGPYWVAPIQRVESGQGLRAKIYGDLGKEKISDAGNPDFGWVNDLVT